MTTDAHIQYLQDQCFHEQVEDVSKDIEVSEIVCKDCGENVTMEYYNL